MIKLVKRLREVITSSKGFTLLELLVVVLIIGILAAIALPQYRRVKEKSIMAEGMQLTKQIAEANQRYYLIHGEYADDIRDLDIEFGGDTIKAGSIYRIETNHFTVSTHGTNYNVIGLAHRRPFGERYYIQIDKTNINRFMCHTYDDATEIQKELCTKLRNEGHL